MGNVWGEEASAEPEATKPSTEDVVEACPTPQEPLVEEGKSRHVGEEAMWSAHGPEVPKDLGAQVPGMKETSTDMPEPSSAETSPSVSRGQSDTPKEAASPQPLLLLPVANRRLVSPSPANLSPGPLDQHLKANRWLMSPSHANSSPHEQHMKVPSLLLGRATPQGLEDEEPPTPLKLLLPLDKRGSTEVPNIVVSELSPKLQSMPLSLLPSSPCRQSLRTPSPAPSPSSSGSQGQPRRSALKTPTTGKLAASSTKRVRFHEDVKPCPEDDEFFLYSVFAAGWQMLPQLF